MGAKNDRYGRPFSCPHVPASSSNPKTPKNFCAPLRGGRGKGGKGVKEQGGKRIKQTTNYASPGENKHNTTENHHSCRGSLGSPPAAERRSPRPAVVAPRAATHNTANSPGRLDLARRTIPRRCRRRPPGRTGSDRERGKMPTGDVRSSFGFARVADARLPIRCPTGTRRPAGPRAAASHSQFAGQPAAGPLGKRFRLPERHAHHRLIRAVPLGVPPLLRLGHLSCCSPLPALLRPPLRIARSRLRRGTRRTASWSRDNATSGTARRTWNFCFWNGVCRTSFAAAHLVLPRRDLDPAPRIVVIPQDRRRSAGRPAGRGPGPVRRAAAGGTSCSIGRQAQLAERSTSPVRRRAACPAGSAGRRRATARPSDRSPACPKAGFRARSISLFAAAGCRLRQRDA